MDKSKIALNTFKQIIRESSYDNTYKMAWARGLVELSTELDLNDNTIVITLDMIARKYLKYYWNQTIFFNLRQGSNPLKLPVIQQIVTDLINKYYEFVGNNNPILYERVEIILLSKLNIDYDLSIRNIVKALKQDVSYRFLYLNKVFHDEIYKYAINDSELYMSKDLLLELKENELDLYELINYRWALILETFNSSPRINKKVKIMDDREIKRSNLSKYKYYLDLENNNHVCFYCGNNIEDKELSIDHVIPWSYMYSDDIWNLVYVCRSCNSVKSNKAPDKDAIDKLIARNKKLEVLLNLENKHNKITEELSLANNKDYVNKFWIGSKN